MVRLFRAWSVVDNFYGKDQVIFNWFVVGRPKPIDSYEELIENYDESHDEAWCDRLVVDELFTEAEIEELRDYVFNSHKLEVRIEEVSLPVRAGELSYGLLLVNGVEGFYALAEEDGYDLSVSVLGHFDIEEDYLSKRLSYEDVQKGIDFLKIVFNNLNLSPLQQDDLINLLNQIYEETGLFVYKDNNIPGKVSSN